MASPTCSFVVTLFLVLVVDSTLAVNYSSSTSNPAVCSASSVSSCTVIGVGMYVFDINDINILQGTFFASYQLTLYQDLTTYPNCGDAIHSMDSGRECSNFANGSRWSPWSVSKGDLVFRDLPNSASINFADAEVGRYFVKGVHYFSPNFAGFPFQRNFLELRVSVRNQTIPCALEHTTPIRFCSISELNDLDPDIPVFKDSLDGEDTAFSFKVDSKCWPPLNGNNKCNEEVDEFVGFILYGLKGAKAFIIVALKSILSATLAILSYFVPYDFIPARFSLFVFAILNVAISQSDNVDKFLAKAAPYTRADYIGDAVLIVLFIAIWHGIVMAQVAACLKIKFPLPKAEDYANDFQLYHKDSNTQEATHKEQFGTVNRVLGLMAVPLHLLFLILSLLVSNYAKRDRLCNLFLSTAIVCEGPPAFAGIVVLTVWWCKAHGKSDKSGRETVPDENNCKWCHITRKKIVVGVLIFLVVLTIILVDSIYSNKGNDP